MGSRGLLGIGFVVACGGGTSGDPLMGTVSLSYGSEKPKMVVGSAVQHENTPGDMLVQIGSDNVDCNTFLDVFLDFSTPEGHFIYFSADKAMTGTFTNKSIDVMKSSDNSTSINGSTGSYTIDSLGAAAGDRVTGSVMVTTTDEEVGTITAMGTFDVKRCF